ncbi:hypothetical protein [Intestinibacillus massiliensis]|uniref:hypothetical protein n=1 Tax=Intestinibacillus massiliensis TaxID=1871029 RepID=UPI00117A97FC|nr:hypothetical protein [Intestinibacillus massiliensis]
MSITQSDASQGVTIARADDGCTITIAVDVRILELVIQLEDSQITILPSEYTYADNRGRVIMPGGTATVGSGVVVTPGEISTCRGKIVIPGGGGSNAAVILPDDTVVYLDKRMEGGGYTIAPDGTVTLPDGTGIKPGGQIATPEGIGQPPRR